MRFRNNHDFCLFVQILSHFAVQYIFMHSRHQVTHKILVMQLTGENSYFRNLIIVNLNLISPLPLILFLRHYLLIYLL